MAEEATKGEQDRLQRDQDKMQRDQDKLDSRLLAVDGKLGSIDGRLIRVEEHLVAIDGRLGLHSTMMDGIGSKLEPLSKLQDRQDRNIEEIGYIKRKLEGMWTKLLSAAGVVTLILNAIWNAVVGHK